MPHLPPYVVAKGAALIFKRRIPARLYSPETRHRICVALRTRCPREAGRRAAALNALMEAALTAGTPLDDARALLRMAVEKLDALPASMSPVARVRAESDIDAEIRRALAGLPHTLGDPVEVEPPTPAEEAYVAALAAGQSAPNTPAKAAPAPVRPAMPAPAGEPRQGRKTATHDASTSPPRPRPGATLRSGDPDGFLSWAGRYVDRRLAGYLCEEREETPDAAIGESFRGASLGNYQAAIRLWADALGNKRPRDYTPQDAREVMALLARVPSAHGKGRYVPVREAIRLADDQEKRAMVEIAASGASPGAVEVAQERARVPRLRTNTIKRYHSQLSQIFAGAIADGLRPENPMAGAGMSRKVKAIRRAGEGGPDRRAWTPAELRTLAAATPDDLALFWAPRIAVATGARMEVILALRGTDFRDDGAGGWLVAFAARGGGRNKTIRRDVPVASALVEGGLVALAQSVGPERLFPDVARDKTRGRLSGTFSKDFTAHRQSLGLNAAGLDFHGFRTTANSAMEASGATLTVRQAVVGWSSSELADSDYLRQGPAWAGRRAAVEAIPLRAWFGQE